MAASDRELGPHRCRVHLHGRLAGDQVTAGEVVRKALKIAGFIALLIMYLCMVVLLDSPRYSEGGLRPNISQEVTS